ncbi:hypothetical protein FJW07_21515 [Mesorhizobium sp. B3-1-9]|uniref:hypothetical protein n=1 Tax=unclassified Mesorhizobium TaxID=325217 RepID=UPI00112DEC24|nr:MULTISPECIES: hypothetical protein [unclassified Mesorhizobium]TPI35607.1 hypothetical protein FJ414_18200 [Mesorhizobium sp. B3-1-6]TPI36230.1 hypothetical protein FJW07_21515 [Mesorhizobium sp. B3-1-9]TPI64567.1 hypothetical protein FJ417_02755 [Mesorhizobium sp. B3-1-7]TPI66235.1 hypothetical protein FJ424_13400 [Mesorhizobium sp. B3-1-8]TPI73227.1 hypothetical protein FJ420_09785 [Mesorhizobium sp. B3-1-3]
MRKRFSSLMRSLTLGGLIATGAARSLIIFTASPVPDPASGRTEPELFAPLISSSFDYITPAQSWMLLVLTGITLIGLAGWIFFAFMERGSGMDGDVGSGRSGTPLRRPVGRQDR